MTISCSACHSSHIISRDLAKKTGALIGTVGGAASGAVGALGGARIGTAVGSAVGPIGTALGALAGALMGALMGAASGNMAGAAVGELVDKTLLDNFLCLSCGHTSAFRWSGPDPLFTAPEPPVALLRTLLQPLS